MPKDGTATREKILDTAQALMFEHGFSATTLDKVLDGAGLTKGAFFHHFKNKNDLAATLIGRYLETEERMIKDLFDRAGRISRDPLQQVLIFIGLMVEAIDGGEPISDGCLLATYAFEFAEFDASVRKQAQSGLALWRDEIGARIQVAIDANPTRIPVTGIDLADSMLAAFEGGLVIAKLDGDPKITARKLEHFRDYLELLFTPAEE